MPLDLVLGFLLISLVRLGDIVGGEISVLLALLIYGDLIMLIDRILEQRSRDTVCVTKVKGNADAEMVWVGQVRERDSLGNAAADEVADFRRWAVVDARRKLSILLFWSCIASSLPSLVLWSIMMNCEVLPQILSYDLLELFPRGVSWFMLCATTLCCVARCYLCPGLGQFASCCYCC